MNNARFKYMTPLLAFLAIAGVLGTGLTLDPKHLPSTRIDKPAPDFDLPLLKQPQRFSPADLLGKRWLLNVWASWCVGCRIEHPLLNQLAEQTEIIMVGLNYKDEADHARRWLADRGNPYQLIPVDYAGDVGIEYGVYGVPETFVIDEQGVVIYKHTGPLTLQAVKDELLPLFEGGDENPGLATRLSNDDKE